MTNGGSNKIYIYIYIYIYTHTYIHIFGRFPVVGFRNEKKCDVKKFSKVLQCVKLEKNG